MTNGDRYRSMSDEELAVNLLNNRSNPHCPPTAVAFSPCEEKIDCYHCWLDWLQQEVMP